MLMLVLIGATSFTFAASGEIDWVEKVHNDINTTTFNNSLSPENDRMYFTQVASDFSGIGIYVGHLKHGKVTKVKPLQINGMDLQGTDVHISPDGTKLLYSARSGFNSDEPLADYELYMSEKSDNGWGIPKLLPKAINSSSDEFYPSVTNKGDIYFARRIEGDNLDIFVSRYENGSYQTANRLGQEVNTGILEGDAFIAPDESYLVFARMKASDSMGMTDLYISYRQANGWTKAVNLGPSVNSIGIDGSPFVSSDGRWLYFTSNRESKSPEKFDNQLGLYRVPFGPAPVLLDLSSIDYGSSLSRDGTYMYYSNASAGFSSRQLMQAELQQGQVVKQSPLLLAGKSFQGSDVQLSPDGKSLLFKTRKNFGRLQGRKDGNIYIAERSGDGWGQPEPLPDTVNSMVDEYYPLLTNSGNLYFSRQTAAQSYDLYVSEFVDGKYQQAKPLNSKVNTPYLESDAYISPDEQFMVFVRMYVERDYGVSDLYISYRDQSISNIAQSWSEPVNLGAHYNFEGVDGSPFISHDQRWLYFTSNRTSDQPSEFDEHLGIYRMPFSLRIEVTSESR